VLLVEPREIVRAELHKFFEAHGFNLMEAEDATEAITLAEMREGALDLVVAPKVEAQQIQEALRETHPNLAMLTIVDDVEKSPAELRRSYTQSALLERVRMLFQESDRKHAEEAARAKALAEEAAQGPEPEAEGAPSVQVQSAAAGSE
jgi:DNA-binding NarL/FixJ family response regulator